MDNLKEYIKQNREAFDDKEIPEGHLERFEARLEQLAEEGRRQEGSTRLTVRRPRFLIGWLSVGIAAALAGIIFLNRPAGDGWNWPSGRQDRLAVSGAEWFEGIGDDQYEICNAYYDKVSELYETILRNNSDKEIEETLDMISGETIPLVDQLPEEMDPETRAAVLKEYYGGLLDGLERINNLK